MEYVIDEKINFFNLYVQDEFIGTYHPAELYYILNTKFSGFPITISIKDNHVLVRKSL